MKAASGRSHGLRETQVARLDSTILHEIARIVQAQAKVPERLRIQNREYEITYLDDHRQRIEEALRRHDSDRLSMLFGQLASKVKYQLLRQVGAPSAQRAATRARNRSASAKVRNRARSR